MGKKPVLEDLQLAAEALRIAARPCGPQDASRVYPRATTKSLDCARSHQPFSVVV